MFSEPKIHMKLKIISGGQTGADRAALDWAIARGVPHGGWCPKGRLAEDGVIPDRYCLKETPDSDYAQRTEWNARDSDGTVIFSMTPELTGGSKFTEIIARSHGKPCLHLAYEDIGSAASRLARFLHDHDIHVLNVAGPRASYEFLVGEFVKKVLEKFWGSLDEPE